MGGRLTLNKTPLQPVDAFVRTSRMKVAVLIAKTMPNTMPNVCPTKELVKLIASTSKLRVVNQLANMQKSTFTPGQYVCGLSKSSRYAPRTYCALSSQKLLFLVKRRSKEKWDKEEVITLPEFKTGVLARISPGRQNLFKVARIWKEIHL